MNARERDIYGRKPTSRSRGKTADRIMALQHEQGQLPGAEDVLADAPEGSIAASVQAFHTSWVEKQAVTSRRAYERSLVLLLRHLVDDGPAPTNPVATLNSARFAAHLHWRASQGLTDKAELQRAAVHLTRLATWLDEHASTSLSLDADELRNLAANLAE